MMPEFDLPKDLPIVSDDIGDSYVLLGARERYAHSMPEQELCCLMKFFQDQGIVLPANWTTHVQKWARLRLPNEQIVRSSWKEKARALQNVRIARNIMVCLGI